MHGSLRFFAVLLTILCLLNVLCVSAETEETAKMLEVNATTLADGTYTPDGFAFTGGTGKMKITCTEVIVEDGLAYATLAFSSKHLGYVKVGDVEYFPVDSVVTIPVALNRNTSVFVLTTAMSAPHEIEYTISVSLSEGEESGFNRLETQTPEHAKLFTLSRCEDGITVIDIADAGRYVLTPEGTEVPVTLTADAVVIQVPVTGIYAATETVMDAAGTCATSTALEAFATDTCVFAGTLDAPEYAVLLKTHCELAVVPYGFAADCPETADRLATLGIPVFVDRCAGETDDEARSEWAQVYALLFGTEA